MTSESAATDVKERKQARPRDMDDDIQRMLLHFQIDSLDQMRHQRYDLPAGGGVVPALPDPLQIMRLQVDTMAAHADRQPAKRTKKKKKNRTGGQRRKARALRRKAAAESQQPAAAPPVWTRHRGSAAATALLAAAFASS